MAMSHGLTRGFQSAGRPGCGFFKVIPAPEAGVDAGCNSGKTLLLTLFLVMCRPGKFGG
jgi:hypothetical protein